MNENMNVHSTRIWKLKMNINVSAGAALNRRQTLGIILGAI